MRLWVVSIFALFSSITISVIARAQAVETDRYALVRERLMKMEMVIFDLDSTLVRSRHMLGSDAWFNAEMQAGMARGLSKNDARLEAEAKSDELQKMQDYSPVEPGVARLIRDLQSHGVIVMIETARRVPQMESAFRGLKQLGVDMSLTAPKLAAPSELIYENGVLFASALPKGPVLAKFLEEAKLKPRSIAFVDDKQYNLDSVTEILKKTSPEFMTVLYTGADENNAKFRFDVARVQERAYLSGVRLPSDAEALAFIRAGGRCQMLFY